MPPINLEQQSSRSASTQVSAGLESCIQLPFFAEECSVDSLSSAGYVEHQKLKALEIELNELFEVTKDFKNNNLEYHRKRLSDIFKTSEAEKAEAYKKLDFIRKQLVNLEMSSGESSKQGTNDSDSGFSSKCDSDQDAKILNALRHRLRRINDMNFELKKCVQMLRIENSELSTSLKTEKTFAQRNSDTLKDLADMLSGMNSRSPWKGFSSLCENFLGSTKSQNYEEVVSNMLSAYQAMGCNMSIKLHHLHAHLNMFPSNLGQMNDEQGERFHQEIL